MRKSKANYQKQCKIKTITFYKKDGLLLYYANNINFQKFVKEALRKSIDELLICGVDVEGDYERYYGVDHGEFIQDN